MLGKIEGRRRKGCQRTRCLDSITNAMDVDLGKLQEMVRDRETLCAAVHGGAKYLYWRMVGLQCHVRFCCTTRCGSYTHTAPLLWIPVPSRAPSGAPCALQRVLFSYLFHTQQCIRVSLKTHPLPLPFSVSIHLFSTSPSLFLLCK